MDSTAPVGTARLRTPMEGVDAHGTTAAAPATGRIHNLLMRTEKGVRSGAAALGGATAVSAESSERMPAAMDRAWRAQTRRSRCTCMRRLLLCD